MPSIPSILASLVLLVALPVPAAPVVAADDPYIEIVEVFMDAQAAHLSALARRFGVSNQGSELVFQSQFNPDLTGFSFATEAGSSYLGHPLDVQVSGSLDPITDEWLLVSILRVGNQTATGKGKAKAKVPERLGPAPKDGDGKTDVEIDFGGIVYDYHSQTRIFGALDIWLSDTVYVETLDGDITAFGTLRDRGLVGGPGWFWRSTSHVDLDGLFDAFERFWGFLGAEGEIDRATGAGRFVARTGVPAPPTAALILLALVAGSALGSRGRGKRRG